MTSTAPSYRGYRFPREIISHAVWLYLLVSTSSLGRQKNASGDRLHQGGPSDALTIRIVTPTSWPRSTAPVFQISIAGNVLGQHFHGDGASARAPKRSRTA